MIFSTQNPDPHKDCVKMQLINTIYIFSFVTALIYLKFREIIIIFQCYLY